MEISTSLDLGERVRLAQRSQECLPLLQTVAPLVEEVGAVRADHDVPPF
jgi:hypothetical protein